MAFQLVQPTRSVPFGDTVIDQFSAYDSDGYTKVAGLNVSTAIVATVYRDGALVGSPPTVTLAAIGSGEYTFSFTPDQIGIWVVEIRILSLLQTWKGQYDVRAQTLSGQVFNDVVRDENGRGIPYGLVEVLDASDNTTVLATAITEYDGSYSIELSGLLSGNPLVSLRFSGSRMTTKLKQNVRLG